MITLIIIYLNVKNKSKDIIKTKLNNCHFFANKKKYTLMTENNITISLRNCFLLL